MEKILYIQSHIISIDFGLSYWPLEILSYVKTNNLSTTTCNVYIYEAVLWSVYVCKNKRSFMCNFMIYTYPLNAGKTILWIHVAFIIWWKAFLAWNVIYLSLHSEIKTSFVFSTFTHAQETNTSYLSLSRKISC